MRAIKQARKIIVNDPFSEIGKTLTLLILSLETETDFSLKKIYNLSMDDFELVIEVMKDWRLDRYYEGKAKAISTALQASDLK